MRYYAPGTRPPSQLVSPKGVGGMFWYALLVIPLVTGIAFWPSVFVHGPARVPVEWAWYGGIAAILFFGMIFASISGEHVPEAKPPSPRPPQPHPIRPDLRETADATSIE